MSLFLRHVRSKNPRKVLFIPLTTWFFAMQPHRADGTPSDYNLTRRRAPASSGYCNNQFSVIFTNLLISRRDLVKGTSEVKQTILAIPKHLLLNLRWHRCFAALRWRFCPSIAITPKPLYRILYNFTSRLSYSSWTDMPVLALLLLSFDRSTTFCENDILWNWSSKKHSVYSSPCLHDAIQLLQSYFMPCD